MIQEASQISVGSISVYIWLVTLQGDSCNPPICLQYSLYMHLHCQLQPARGAQDSATTCLLLFVLAALGAEKCQQNITFFNDQTVNSHNVSLKTPPATYQAY